MIVSEFQESFYAYLSNKNSAVPDLPIASTILPTPINTIEANYEFALQRLEITERWYNLTADDLAFRLVDLHPEKKGQVIALIHVTPEYCADIRAFVAHLNKCIDKVMPAGVDKLVEAKESSPGNPQNGKLEIGILIAVEFTASLGKIMQLRTLGFDNVSKTNRSKIYFNFDPLPSRYLNIVSRLAPIAYAFNSTANMLGTVHLPLSSTEQSDRIISADVPSPLAYFPVRIPRLDKLEIEVRDHEGQPLRLRKGCIITCVLHFRKISPSKSMAYVVQKARRREP
jgi:hypothetical protein